ncbi:MAG: hypothetical protein IJZ32_01995 [Clostridia bacterium]|nr:hypothetical protein [Clostridia bacterium]
MKNESVAILDIRSGEVSFLLGSKGVNGTFVFGGSHSESYEGYFIDGFLDEESFRRAVVAAITSVRQNYEGVIGEIFVGVPSPFVTVRTKGHTLSFRSKRKLSSQDIQALYESGLDELMAEGRCIRRSAMYFTLGDNRKYFNAEALYGVPTNMLKGALCYYFVSDGFYDTVTKVLGDLGFDDVKLIPSTLAQSVYLLPEQKREGYAFLLDIGFLTTSVSVIYGNGIVHEESFNCGVGTILVSLMEALDIDYPLATEILASANISGGSVPRDMLWSTEQGDRQFSVQEINDIIKCGLDVMCEQVDGFFTERYKDKSAALAVNPISVTGEGISGIRGAAEHVSRRLNRLTEIVYPDLPYYDKPAFSSRIALLNTAISDGKKRGLWQRIFNAFGGRKK